MLGAIIGDIVGSRFEFNNRRSKGFDLFAKDCYATDDTVMTIAVAKAIMEADAQCPRPLDGDTRPHDTLLSELMVKRMQGIGRHYPHCGYGERFMPWMFSEHPKPYNSFGNGAAMRMSAAGWAARTMEEAKALSKIVTAVTHNHPEGIKGAEATAVAIFMARRGATREDIRSEIVLHYYPLDFTISRIRDTYQFNETCQDTVPQAIEAFLESTSFEDAIRTAISVGGDSDTLAAITGSIAEAYYGVPDDLRVKALSYLDERLHMIYLEWETFTAHDPCRERHHVLTKYIGPFEMVKLHDEDKSLDGLTPFGALASQFIDEFDGFIRLDPTFHNIGPATMFEKYGLGTSLECSQARLAQLDADRVMRLIWGNTHCDCYSEGLAESFYERGDALRCLKRLKALDAYDGALEYVELSTIAFSAFGNVTCRITFNEHGAVMTSKKYCRVQEPIAYTLREASDWVAAYRAVHPEHWESAYAYCEVTDGEKWRLIEKRVGARETVLVGDNAQPNNWGWLATLLGIRDEMRLDDEYVDERLRWNPAIPTIRELSFRVERLYKSGDVACTETTEIHRDEGRFSFSCKDEKASHSTDWTNAPEALYLALWAAHFCLSSPGWKGSDPSGACRTFALTARYDDGTESKRAGRFFRDDLPLQAWKTLLHELEALRKRQFASQSLDVDALACAEPDGSAEYASVLLDGGNRTFYYQNMQNDVHIGSRVRVPFGAENKERVGTVKAIARYEAGTYPFPLSNTKRLLGLAAEDVN
ncbi:MAG: ADP-ribosylglycohydrolase family protein [Clostridia bacterium]